MIRVLGVLCILLLAVVAAEATSYRPGANDLAGERHGTAEQVPPWAAKDTTGTAREVDQWLAVALARPLFAPDRKPVGDPVGAHVGLPRLAGIIAAADEAVAIFQPPGNGKPVVARHGDRIAGWQVTMVATDAVSLQKANDRIVLRPRFNGSDVAAAAGSEAKPSRSRWEAAAPAGVLRARWSNPQLQP
jgi:hypothetical protein